MSLILSKVKAEGFKAHVMIEATFTEDLNVITGPNGAGKTNLIRAVLFALGGASFVTGGSKRLVNDTCSKMSVEVTFTGDRTVTITRTKSTAKVEVNGEEVAKSTTPVNRYIEREILGMSMKRFMALRVGQQKLCAALLTAGTTRLHSIIEELGDVAQVNSVISKCGTLAAGADAAKTNLEQWLAEMSTAEEQAGELVETIAKLDAQLKSAKEHQQDLHAGWRKAKDALNEATQANEAAHRHNARRTALEEASDAAKRKLDQHVLVEEPDVEDHMAAHAALKEANEQVAELRVQIESAGKLNAQRDNLEYRIRVLEIPDEVAVPEGVDGIDKLTEEMNQQNAVTAKLHAELDVCRKAAQGSECPTCKRPFEEHDPAQLKAELNAAQAAYDEAVGLQTELADEILRLNRLKAGHKQATEARDYALERLADLRQSLAQLDPAVDVTDAQEQLTQAQQDLEHWQQESERMDRQGDAAQKSIDREHELQQEYQAIRDQLLAHGPAQDIQPVENLQRLESTRHTAMSEGADQYARLEQEHVSANREYDAIEVRYGRLEENVKQAKASLQKTATAAALKTYLTKNRDRFLSSVWDSLTASAAQFATTATEGAVTALKRGDEGFQWHNGTAWYPADDASGAQATILGIGIQQALAHLLPCGLNMIVLDEPTADSSEEVSASIMMLLSGLGMQVIAVSHKHEDAAVAKNLVTVERAA